MKAATPKPWPEVQQLIGPLASDRREELRASLDRFGYRGPPIYVMPDGRIIDGHNRYELCGDGCPREVLDVDEATGFALALAHNQARRQLTPDQLRATRAAQKRTALDLRKAGKTQAEAAAAVGVSRQAVAKWEADQAGDASIATRSNTCIPDTRVKVPAALNGEIAARVKAGETQAQVAADYGVTRQRVAQILRKVQKARETEAKQEQARAAAAALKLPNGVEIDHCAFEKQAERIPDASVSLIFTDPPYARQNLPLYERIAEIGARVLAPGGSLLCYCGHFLIPDLYLAMTPHLRPWWIVAATHGGELARMTEYGIVVHWKPILWFVQGSRGDKQTFVGDLTRGEREKSDHPWQQSESEARYWIERLTRPGDLVWDPFCGSGTTAAAAHGLGRIVVTCDIDADAVASARLRLVHEEAA